MKRVILAFIAAGLLAAGPGLGQPLAVTGSDQRTDGLTLDLAQGKLRLRPISNRVIRVTYAPDGVFSDRPSLVALEPPAEGAKAEFIEDQASIGLDLDGLRVMVDRETGAVSFVAPDGTVALAEPASGGKSARRARVQGEEIWQVRQEFDFAPGEALYGLGQFQDGYMNYRGRELTLVQANQIAVNPFLVSTRGCGVLWDNYSKTIFNDDGGAGGASTGSLWSEVADGIDYYFIYGPELDEVIAGYRRLTGTAPLFGKWAYGYFQSKERYRSFDELVAVVEEYRERGIPLDAIVQDWMYWGKLGWSPLEFDQSGPFRDPAARIQQIHDLNAHLMISIWPIVSVKSDAYRELNAAGHLFPVKPFSYYLPGIYKMNGRIYDPFSPEARDIYWKYVKRGFVDQGMDAFWMDGTEPEFGNATDPGPSSNTFKKNQTCELGTIARYLNAYSLMTTRAVYEGWRRDAPAKRLFILTRSVFAGQQRYAAATWSGDIKATWEVLHNQIAGGVNFSLAGVPYWTTDIGGFFTDPLLVGRNTKNLDPAYRELYVRWFQFGAFCPIFRSHGTNTPREIWRFGGPGDETYDTLVKFDNLRYRLMPYIYSLAGMVTNQHYTIMRGLALDFRNDPKVYNIADQFMFGPALLVNPVTKPIKNNQTPARDLYLPRAEGWFDFWTGEAQTPGTAITAPAPLSIMPLYVRAGSILPMGPFIQYASENADPLEVRVYPGADGAFTLYEDENDNYNYETGAQATIGFTWDDSARTLTIGPRQGRFPGMLETRTFNIVRVGPGHGVGELTTAMPDRTVAYQGEAVTVDLKP